MFVGAAQHKSPAGQGYKIIDSENGSGSILFQPFFIGNRKLFAAFFSPAGEYGTAVGGLHPLTETMHGFTATLVGLESTFHDLFIFSFK